VLWIEKFELGEEVYLVFEYASEGDLFDYVKMKGKLQEDEVSSRFLSIFWFHLPFYFFFSYRLFVFFGPLISLFLPSFVKARNFFRQLLIGVRYAHEHHFIHRDLKLENIYLRKIVDDVPIGQSPASATGTPDLYSERSGQSIQIVIGDWGFAGKVVFFLFLLLFFFFPSHETVSFGLFLLLRSTAVESIDFDIRWVSWKHPLCCPWNLGSLALSRPRSRCVESGSCFILYGYWKDAL
jgi:serine/threonine protein kinase